jgi:hypothetical protein
MVPPSFDAMTVVHSLHRSRAICEQGDRGGQNAAARATICGGWRNATHVAKGTFDAEDS